MQRSIATSDPQIPKQAGGNSVDRQIEYARGWAKARGLPLDETLRLTEALAFGTVDGAAPLALVRKLNDLEKASSEAQGKLQDVERKAIAATAKVTPANAKQWAELSAAQS